MNKWHPDDVLIAAVAVGTVVVLFSLGLAVVIDAWKCSL